MFTVVMLTGVAVKVSSRVTEPPNRDGNRIHDERQSGGAERHSEPTLFKANILDGLPASLASTAWHANALFLRPPPPSGLIGVHTIRQKSGLRYVDAHVVQQKDWAVVTRPRQNNDTQRWIFSMEREGIYRIQQQSTGRYLDAHDTPDKDFAVVTRPFQPNLTQQWTVTPSGNGAYRIRQLQTGRYLDAHQIPARDFAVVLRPWQPNSTQEWIISP
jgi:hypothetical protein